MGLPTIPLGGSNRSLRSNPLRVPILLALMALVFYLQFSHLSKQAFETPASVVKLHEANLHALERGLQKCDDAYLQPVEYQFPVSLARTNPRWNSRHGQNRSVLLANATLFDGEHVLSDQVNILFDKGIIKSVTPASSGTPVMGEDVLTTDLRGNFVTPGLVDMHSHHLLMPWPDLPSTDDGNEENDLTGPLTPFVRSLDGMKPYDFATTAIASGGVTSSLILPGSANIIGGEAFPVKNVLGSGADGEEVVEEMLLEYGVPRADRRRYMKAACGENPRRSYKHTRMGNAWLLRQLMTRGQKLVEKQDSWCLSAAVARDSSDVDTVASFLQTKGDFPEDLELESTAAILRGNINLNIHCYEQEDFEDMLRHSKEFGFRIAAFHHAIEAWRVPDMIKDSGQNITIATFSLLSLFKHEAYDPNLQAGAILSEHGVPVAYKSDHVGEETNAKYLMFQAAEAHAFGLSAELALQSVTSVPARSMQMDHRVGFVRSGYDADLVIWNGSPLKVGATPLQVYIDGKATIDPLKAETNVPSLYEKSDEWPKVRPAPDPRTREMFCERARKAEKIVVTGISQSYLDLPGESGTFGSPSGEKMTMVIEAGRISFLGRDSDAALDAEAEVDTTVIELEAGFVLPGLSAYTSGLGMREIASEDSTGDGVSSSKVSPLDPDNVLYAKYGVHLEGKAFQRAKIGGVTRAISPPLNGGDDGAFLTGVSVGIMTSGNGTLLNGGIFQDEVALHFQIGQSTKGAEGTPTISSEIAKLRKILKDNIGKDNVYGRAANGSLPLVIRADNKYDIMQLIKVKQDFSQVDLVLVGGSEAYTVAEELASAEVPLLLTPIRTAPSSFEKLDTLIGPPLTPSPVTILSQANVTFGVAIAGGVSAGDAGIHNLVIEAAWAAKYAGLSDRTAVDLVSRRIEQILKLERSEDFVIYEGNPLEFGASVVLTLNGGIHGRRGGVAECWPQST